MKCEYKDYELSNAITDIAAGPFGSNLKVSCFTTTGFPIIDGANLKEFTVTDNITKFVSEDKARSLHRSIAKRRDVVVTISGNVGQVSYIPDNSQYAEYLCSQRQFRVTFDESKIYVPYLVYYLHSVEGQSKILAFANQTGVPALSQPLKNFRKIKIDLPSLAEQKKISAILSALDEKIAINRAINENLALQMQTIWENLFCSGMESGNRVSLGDYLYIKGRIGWKGLKKEEYLSESPYRIINGESLTANGIDWSKAGFIPANRYNESPEIMLQIGDILISKDGTIGKVGYVDKLDKPTSVASGIFIVRNLKPQVVSTIFIYCLLTSSYFKEFIASRTEGSVIPHLYQKDFVTLDVPLLSEKQLRYFNDTVTPLFDMYFANQRENLRLSEVRDVLLPKLMSGEINII